MIEPINTTTLQFTDIGRHQADGGSLNEGEHLKAPSFTVTV